MTITIIAPLDAASAVQPNNKLSVSRIDPDIKLLAGTYCSAGEAWIEEQLEDGLQLVLVQSGQLRCRVSGQPEHLIRGPMLCMIANEGDYTSAQLFAADQPLRYTIIRLSAEALEGFGGLPDQLRLRSSGDPRIMSCAAPRAMQALASQIATCPMAGPIRDFYLGGKALELAAVGAQFLAGEAPLGQIQRITHSEVERIHAARDMLVSTLNDLPTLDQLALQVGMNRRKLTEGFRKVFGTTVFDYLQEYRLREAHRMLCDEEANVSTVAYRVGYSSAHFSIAFRKRYGISPSEVR